MATQIARGSPQAISMESAALFAQVQRRGNFAKLMRGAAPQQSRAERKIRDVKQTTTSMPIVQVRDLERSKGDTVNLDVVGRIAGYPVMGDSPIEQRSMSLDFGAMKMTINQYRGMVDTGGRMARQRTRWMLNPIARAQLAAWNARTVDQLLTVHLAGARGTYNGRLWNVPLDTHPDFNKVVVNQVRCPTKSRYFLPNGKTSPANLANTDDLELEFFDLIRAELDSMEFPPEPLEIPEAEDWMDEPLFCAFVTPWQWYYIEQKTKSRNWRDMLMASLQRAQNTSKHPVFRSALGVYAGFVIRKMPFVIGWQSGDSMKYCAGDDLTESTVTAAVTTHRGLIVGGQAIGEAYGAHDETGGHAFWNEERTDHGNRREISTGMVMGIAKVTFQDEEDKWNDHGVMAFDSYAPDPKSADGRKLVTHVNAT